MSFIYNPSHNNEPKREKRPQVVIKRMVMFENGIENTNRALRFIRTKVQGDGGSLFLSSVPEWVKNHEAAASGHVIDKVGKKTIQAAESAVPQSIDKMPKPSADPQAQIDLKEKVITDPNLFDAMAADMKDPQDDLERAYQAPAATKKDMPENHPDADVTEDGLDAKALGDEAKEFAKTTKEAYAYLAKVA